MSEQVQQQVVNSLKEKVAEVMASPAVNTPEAIMKTLHEVMEAAQVIDKSLQGIRSIIDQLGRTSHTGHAAIIYYNGYGLTKTGISAKTGKRWEVKVLDKDITEVMKHIGTREGETIRARNIIHATGVTRIKAYIVLGALEDIGVIEHTTGQQYVRSGVSNMGIWERLQRLINRGQHGGKARETETG